MRIVDIFLAFPGMVLALAVAGLLGKGLNNAVIALAATGWPPYARLMRGQVLTLKEKNFVHAAKLNGQTTVSILFLHILPNALRPIVVTASLSIGGTILSLAGLSFLGLGPQPPLAEWGSMIADGRGLMQQHPWIVLYPGLAILLTSILFNLLGDSVRDALDPHDSHNFFRKRKGNEIYEKDDAHNSYHVACLESAGRLREHSAFRTCCYQCCDPASDKREFFGTAGFRLWGVQFLETGPG